MQFTAAIVGAILSATAIAAPTRRDLVDDGYTWTIQSMVRNCASDDTSCSWSFTIASTVADPMSCFYTVTGAAPASQATVSNVQCGIFTVGSAWDPSGFTTLSVADTSANLIAFPAYTDAQLVNGQVVSPDSSFEVYTSS